jgi:hypothetical protein
MKRREFLTLIGGAAASSFSASAQQNSPPVIGFLGSVSASYYLARVLPAFRQVCVELMQSEAA